MKIYGISGLGADERVFNFLSLKDEFIPIEWIEAKANEPIHEYALRLSKVIDTEEKFVLLAVSFGGLYLAVFALQTTIGSNCLVFSS